MADPGPRRRPTFVVAGPVVWVVFLPDGLGTEARPVGFDSPCACCLLDPCWCGGCNEETEGGDE